MAEHIYTAEIVWSSTEGTPDAKYSRAHEWRFDGGISVPASSSSLVVPLPMSVEEAVDPEEAFVAAISSCHMLWFLDLARRAGFSVTGYHDRARGIMALNEERRMAIREVVLSPEISFAGENRPSPEKIEALHHDAHDRCFIANSVKTDIRVEPAESKGE